MDLRGLQLAVEECVNETVSESYPINWDENFITRTILRELRARFGRVVLTGRRLPLHTFWGAYKLTGRPETKFGDVAVIVRIEYRGIDPLEGVGFLEAKKRTQGTARFDEIRLPQLRRIVRRAPRSMLLLYDYENITGFVSEIDAHKFSEWDWRRHLVRASNAVAVANNLVLSRRRRDQSLYRFGTSLSHQLCRRYLRGLDLEFTKGALDVAKGYVRDKLGAPSFLLLVSLTDALQREVQIEINRDAFRELEEKG